MRVKKTLYTEDIPTECQECDCGINNGQLACAVCGKTEFAVLWHKQYPGDVLMACIGCKNAMRVPVCGRAGESP